MHEGYTLRSQSLSPSDQLRTVNPTHTILEAAAALGIGVFVSGPLQQAGLLKESSLESVVERMSDLEPIKVRSGDVHSPWRNEHVGDPTCAGTPCVVVGER